MIRAALLFLALAGCASAPPRPIDIAAPAPNAPTEIATQGEADVLVVALSGGGARAAAFGLGALQQLRDTRGADGRPLTAHLALITSVSGGSLLAAYYGLHGEAGLDTFRGAYLDRDWDSTLHMSVGSPLNWPRVLGGGMNGPERFADWLNANVFDDAQMRDLHGPRIWLNATDLYSGAPFTFSPLYFNALCADLGAVRVADAAAASMAFPIVFAPVLAEPHERCAPLPDWTQHPQTGLARSTARAFAAYRDPNQLSALHLSDGGILDNLGLSALTLQRDIAATPYAPLSARDAARLRRFVVLVVNAEKIRDATFQHEARAPSGRAVTEALFDLFIEDGNRDSYDLFRRALADWRGALIAWRCALTPAELAELVGDVQGWRCDDLSMEADMLAFRDLPEPQRGRLGAIRTRVTLPAAEVDALIAGGRAGVAAKASIRDFAR